MVNRDVIASKLSELATRTSRVRKHAAQTQTELAADADRVDLVAFNLMLVVQICADIASHIVADAGWPNARTLAESFERLHEHAVIGSSTCAALSRAVGLRNVVAHGYAGIDLGSLHKAATQGLNDLDTFAREVAAWIATQA